MIKDAKLFLESEERLVAACCCCHGFAAAECIFSYLPETEVPREKTATLIHRRQAGLPLENREVTQLIQRGSR